MIALSMVRTRQIVLGFGIVTALLLSGCSSAPEREAGQEPVTQTSSAAPSEVAGPAESSAPTESSPSELQTKPSSSPSGPAGKSSEPNKTIASPGNVSKPVDQPAVATPKATAHTPTAKPKPQAPPVTQKRSTKPRDPVSKPATEKTAKPKPVAKPKPRPAPVEKPVAEHKPKPKPPAPKPTQKPKPPVSTVSKQSLATINAMRASKGLKRFKANSGKCPVYATANGNTLDGKDGPVQHKNVVLFNIPDNDSWLEASYVSGGGVYNGIRGGFITVYLCDR